jgi:hypothetical protein
MAAFSSPSRFIVNERERLLEQRLSLLLHELAVLNADAERKDAALADATARADLLDGALTRLRAKSADDAHEVATLGVENDALRAELDARTAQLRERDDQVGALREDVARLAAELAAEADAARVLRGRADATAQRLAERSAAHEADVALRDARIAELHDALNTAIDLRNPDSLRFRAALDAAARDASIAVVAAMREVLAPTRALPPGLRDAAAAAPSVAVFGNADVQRITAAAVKKTGLTEAEVRDVTRLGEEVCFVASLLIASLRENERLREADADAASARAQVALAASEVGFNKELNASLRERERELEGAVLALREELVVSVEAERRRGAEADALRSEAKDLEARTRSLRDEVFAHVREGEEIKATCALVVSADQNDPPLAHVRALHKFAVARREEAAHLLADLSRAREDAAAERRAAGRAAAALAAGLRAFDTPPSLDEIDASDGSEAASPSPEAGAVRLFADVAAAAAERDRNFRAREKALGAELVAATREVVRHVTAAEALRRRLRIQRDASSRAYEAMAASLGGLRAEVLRLEEARAGREADAAALGGALARERARTDAERARADDLFEILRAGGVEEGALGAGEK